MATIVNIHEAKTHLSRLLARVNAGEEIVIAKAGKPYARLCPIQPQTPRQPGGLKGPWDESFWDPLPEAELEGWEK